MPRAHYGSDAPVAFGWVNAAHQLGAGLVAFLGGTARDAFGSYDFVWVAAGALCAMGALMALTIKRPGLDPGLDYAPSARDTV